MFGIPLTLVMISACVERLLNISGKLYDHMKQMPVFKRSEAVGDGGVDLPLLTYSHLTIVFTFVLVGFFLLPAAVFSSIEPEWGYMDALYYCFISLTTIGLGDYIPGDHEKQSFKTMYKIATTCKLCKRIRVYLRLF